MGEPDEQEVLEMFQRFLDELGKDTDVSRGERMITAAALVNAAISLRVAKRLEP